VSRTDGVVEPPAEVRRRYEAAGWWGTEPVHRYVLGAGKPDAVAIRTATGTVTYAELAAQVDRGAAGFAAAGIARGDRVLVQLPNTLELLVTILALIRLGAPPVLAVPALRERELRHVVAATSAVGMVVDARNQRGAALKVGRALTTEFDSLRLLTAVDAPAGALDLRSVLAGPADRATSAGPSAAAGPAQIADDRATVGEADSAGGEAGIRSGEAGSAGGTGGGLSTDEHRPGSVALYLLSSGTTGLPKPIPRTHRDYVYNVAVSAQCAGMTAESVYLPGVPVTHNFALGCPGVFGVLAAGGTAVLTRPATADAALADLAAHGVTIAAAVPSMALQWVEAARAAGTALPRLAVLQVGGARLQPAHARRALDTFGGTIQQVYGMAEGLLNFTRLDDPVDVTVQTQGRPASPGDEWRLADDGELQVRGPYTIGGYLADPAVNAAAFAPGGWYRTGDIVQLHPSGNFVVAGRKKDFINRGGEKVSAEEIETLLSEHDAVRVCAAVAMPSTEFGEAVCLFAVPRPEHALDLGDLRAHLSRHGVARYKLPDRLVVLDTLPTNAVGKIDRVALRAAAAEGGADGGPHRQ
jgi:non-ribosomal peptide synthetase component E (peptide arylation enzyme)